MRYFTLSTCLGLFFSLSFGQSTMTQPRLTSCGITPKYPACATPVCRDGAWEPVAKARGTGCVTTSGVAGQCDGTDIACGLPCPASTAFVAPKYYVLSLLYSPPGCTTSSTYRCPGTGQVDYGQGASLGTKTVNSSSYDQRYSFSVDTTFNVAMIFKLGGGVSGGFGTTSTDTDSQTISTSGSLDIKVNGNSDGGDHDQDVFFLLLNPAVALNANTPGTTTEGCAPTKIDWKSRCLEARR